jgi:hypothetical protein
MKEWLSCATFERLRRMKIGQAADGCAVSTMPIGEKGGKCISARRIDLGQGGTRSILLFLEY